MDLPGLSHFPSCVIPMGTTSYLSGFSDRNTDSADRSEISCSPDRPPKTTPTRIFISLQSQNTKRCRPFSPPLRGLFEEGWLRDQKRNCKASLARADRVVSKLQNRFVAEFDHHPGRPGRSIKEASR